MEQWRGAQEAARRHRIEQVRARTERFDGDATLPSSPAVQRDLTAAITQVKHAAAGHQDHAADDQAAEAELTEQALEELRAVAWGQFMEGETDLVMTAVNSMGRPAAERIYGTDLVQRARRIASSSRSSRLTYGRR
ncbi:MULTISPECIES: hypothetical protein [unclassified Streptomyces]|uniref:hypothetical protein n=1 Tax=unclassified Streptomyces TaxID=2593676 RepID=UPI00081D56DE|nr:MULTISPECIES: hypothetical protein [unclassified Streptomyces]MYZ34412.1 hypothetical protein [Streptomyces sp. SID4917]SCF67199.1 hypothetical protein GA0115259_1008818 [Streptomyces sp. MnatMP-M17]